MVMLTLALLTVLPTRRALMAGAVALLILSREGGTRSPTYCEGRWFLPHAVVPHLRLGCTENRCFPYI